MDAKGCGITRLGLRNALISGRRIVGKLIFSSHRARAGHLWQVALQPDQRQSCLRAVSHNQSSASSKDYDFDAIKYAFDTVDSKDEESADRLAHELEQEAELLKEIGGSTEHLDIISLLPIEDNDSELYSDPKPDTEEPTPVTANSDGDAGVLEIVNDAEERVVEIDEKSDAVHSETSSAPGVGLDLDVITETPIAKLGETSASATEVQTEDALSVEEEEEDDEPEIVPVLMDEFRGNFDTLWPTLVDYMREHNHFPAAGDRKEAFAPVQAKKGILSLARAHTDYLQYIPSSCIETLVEGQLIGPRERKVVNSFSRLKQTFGSLTYDASMGEASFQDLMRVLLRCNVVVEDSSLLGQKGAKEFAEASAVALSWVLQVLLVPECRIPIKRKPKQRPTPSTTPAQQSQTDNSDEKLAKKRKKRVKKTYKDVDMSKFGDQKKHFKSLMRSLRNGGWKCAKCKTKNIGLDENCIKCGAQRMGQKKDAQTETV